MHVAEADRLEAPGRDQGHTTICWIFLLSACISLYLTVSPDRSLKWFQMRKPSNGRCLDVPRCHRLPLIADDSIESLVESWAVRIEPGNFRSTSCGRCSVGSSVNHTELDGRPSNYIMTHYVACLGICAKFTKDRSGVSAALPDQVLEFEGGKKPSWKPSMLAGNVLYLDTWTSWTKGSKHTSLSWLFL